MRRPFILLRRVLALGLLTLTSATVAQEWPSKAIRLVIPIAAGGATDQVARLVAARLSSALGQQVVAENLTGASGSIALQRVAQAEPDGYTLGATASSLHTIAPFTSKLPYDAIGGFTTIGTYASFEFMMVVAPDSPIRSLSELLAKAKRNPMEVSFGSSGVGTGNHLAGVLLANMTGTELNSVPYRGGSPAMLDVIAGRTTFIFDVLGGSVPLVQAGKVRALAVSGPKRHALFPDVPAVAEQVPGYEATGWFGLIGPKGLPAAVVRRLADELARIQASAEYTSQLRALGYSPMPGTPADMAQRIRTDAGKWGEVVRSLPCSLIADRPGC
jgi:tripartite-type tricarboxylate transporter receptor subunit TctC